MINSPLYELGDTLALTGSNTSTSSNGYYYYYSEYTGGGGAGAYENYSYSSSGQTDYREYYSYFASDGSTVDNVNISYTDYQYDSNGRLARDINVSEQEYASGYVYNYVNDTFYYYDNTTGYELDSSVSTFTSTDTQADGSTSTYTSTTVSDYAYTSRPTSVDDYDQRRDVSTYDYDGDGITDSTSYSLRSQTRNGGYSSVSATYDSSGAQTYSSSYDYSYIQKASGNISEYTQSYAGDYDGDGIINYVNEYNSEYEYDSSGNFVSSSYEYINKSDNDEDGVADYVSITKGSRNGSSGKQTVLTWQDNDYGPARLEVEIYKDTNNDYTWDSIRGFTFAFGAPPSSWTTMGGHVATINDTLIV